MASNVQYTLFPSHHHKTWEKGKGSNMTVLVCRRHK
jgi:hypothetical protein